MYREVLQCSVSSKTYDMAGRPYYGHGGPPPPPPHGYPPGQPPPPGFYPGIVFYPIHPGYFYPPHNPEQVQVVDNPPEEMVPELPGETVELPWRAYRWVPACSSQNSLPPGALHVGTDVDGADIYAARSPHEGHILPAKFIPSKNVCYVAFNGEEIVKDQFEVLVPAMFQWQFSTNGEVPPGAVIAGTTDDGEELYFGRVTHDGCTTPGKIHKSHGCCYYPFGGEERNSSEYEVLVFI